MPEPAPLESPPATSEGKALERTPWYLWPNLLSLDAVAVAIVWLWCFATCEHVPILRPIYIALGLVVWVIYTTDRLLDAVRMKDPERSTPRHRFAKQFFVPLVVLCLIATGVAIWLGLYKIPRGLIGRGAMISFLALLYFLMRLAPQNDTQVVFPKEVFCGLIFALGSTYTVFELPGNFPLGIMTAEFGLFVALCTLNCVAISVWEREEDAVNDQGKAIAENWSGSQAFYIKAAFFIAGISAWLGVRGMPNFLAPILISIALSAVLIGAIGLAERALSKNLRRALVDLALLSPLVVVPLLS